VTLVTALPAAAALDRAARAAAADQVRALYDIEPWPDLRFFNSAPCARHAPDLDILCRRCGIRLRRHQRIGAAWMYLGLPGLLGDAVGLGKTAIVLALLAMCRETGELGTHNRAVIVCKAAAIHDPWANELARLLPGIRAYIADGDRQQRTAGYMGDWEIAVVTDRTFAAAHGRKTDRKGDVDLLLNFPVGMLFYDDLDPMRNPDTETAIAVNRLAKRCTRVHAAHATPLQKGRPKELWSFLRPVGGEERLGSLARVESRYPTRARQIAVVKDPRDKTGRTSIRKEVWTDNGLIADPRLVKEFREAVRPLVLRRTARDVDDVDLPEVQYCPEFVDLSPRQRARYEELRRGMLRRLTEDGTEVTRAEAMTAWTRARQICSGLAALDRGPGADDSVKLDRAVDAIAGDLADEKHVVFINFRENVAAMSRRLSEAGVGHVLMWGAETDKRVRQRRLEAFREDPDCRVLAGTTTIETSLNLQAARRVWALDTIPNPARMTQLAGRCRRQGSPFPVVYFHHLLARNTLEEAFLAMLRREDAVADAVWDENESMFSAMTPRQVMRLIATGSIAA
jgi:SNF2 family DNA or RNA helicase